MFDALIKPVIEAGPLGIALAITLIFLGGCIVVIRTLYQDLTKAHDARAKMASDCASSITAATAAVQALEKTVIMITTGISKAEA